jgi:hypothetical protein
MYISIAIIEIIIAMEMYLYTMKIVEIVEIPWWWSSMYKR